MSGGLIGVLQWPMLAGVGLGGLLLGVTPRLTRPDIYFAVTVLPGFRDTPEGTRILRRYRVEVAAHSAVGAVLVIAGGWTSNALPQVGLLWQVCGCVAAFYRARSLTMAHAVAPSPVRESDLGQRSTALPGGWWLQAGLLLLFACVAGYLSARWQDIPVRFPTEFSLDGRPIRWAMRNVAGVYGGMMTAVAACTALALLAYAVVARTRRIRVAGPGATAEGRFRHRVAVILVGLESLLALLSVWASLVPVVGPPGMVATATSVAVMLLFVGLSAAVLMTAGQGGTRLAGPGALGTQGGRPVGDRTEDSYWKAGVFYVNRDDPAFLVEKRFGIGYTVNLGHPAVWLLLVVIVLVVVVLRLADR